MVPRSIRVPLVLSLGLQPVQGCTYWVTQSASPRDVVEEGPTKVRLQRHDGTTLELRRPRVSGDSIVGITRQGAGTGTATGDVAQIATREVNVFTTSLLVLASAAAIGVTVYAIVFSAQVD